MCGDVSVIDPASRCNSAQLYLDIPVDPNFFSPFSDNFRALRIEVRSFFFKSAASFFPYPCVPDHAGLRRKYFATKQSIKLPTATLYNTTLWEVLRLRMEV